MDRGASAPCHRRKAAPCARGRGGSRAAAGERAKPSVARVYLQRGGPRGHVHRGEPRVCMGHSDPRIYPRHGEPRLREPPALARRHTPPPSTPACQALLALNGAPGCPPAAAPRGGKGAWSPLQAAQPRAHENQRGFGLETHWINRSVWGVEHPNSVQPFNP